MDSNTDIGQMIASSPAPEGEVNLCKAERINDFFENLPPEVRRLWPFDLTDEGYETAYISANYTEQHSFRSLKEKQTLELSGIFRNERELYVFDGCYTLEDEQLRFELRSLYKEKGLPQRRFAYLLMERQQRFLTAYDNSRPFDFYDKPSEIRLIAASGKDANGLPINGGQVWATLGMNFFSLNELQNCRLAFEKFAVEKVNVRFSRRDLNAFTKPCHFAVFDNGVRLSAGDGKEISLGKAFMLHYSWHARWQTNNPDAEEKRFAGIFNASDIPPAQRRHLAAKALNRRYRLTVERHYLKAVAAQKRHSLHCYQRLWRLKFNRFLHPTLQRV